MPHTTDQIARLSQQLHMARISRTEQDPLTTQNPDLNLEMAYKIQAHGIQIRQSEGEKVVGYKMGLTSKAKMEQMGLHQPIFGVLTNKMEVSNKSEFHLSDKIHPKTEPEIFLITKTELSGKISTAEAFAGCKDVGIALEILDSRFKGFQYFALPDVVADNASSAFFVLGDRRPAEQVPSLKELNIQMAVNGIEVAQASGSAVLGDPWLSLCALVDLLAQNNKTLPAGSIVLTGAATTAITLEPGTSVSAHLEKIGSVSFTIPR